MELQDGFGRVFKYLRLSITDVCNYRCSYCLPDGYKKCGGPSPLSVDEIRRAAQAFSELGVYKIRLTGGEPTLRSDFTEIASAISDLPAVKTLALTTNGYRLRDCASMWRRAGINTINISLDSLSPENFKRVTGHDRCFEVLQGVDAALDAGFEAVKINAVYLKGINDHEVDDYLEMARNLPVSVRFIELMETGDHAAFFKNYYRPTSDLQATLARKGWTQKIRSADAGPANIYVHSDYQGEFGIIAPYSKDFCTSCNRLRFSSQGDLHLCLFGNFGIPMRVFLQSDSQAEELKQRLLRSVEKKIAGHYLHGGETGATSNLAMIGG